MVWRLEIEDACDEGRVEGRERKLIEQVVKKVQKHKSVEQIVEELEEEEVRISCIIEAAQKHAPEY